MSMKYGIGIPQIYMMLGGIKDPVEAYEAMTRVAQTADECGYETIWLSDHFHYGGMGASVVSPSEDLMFECWTTTAAVARDTKRVRIAQSVTCNGYRNPALLAKMASTVDVLSHGRLTLGIGAGDFEHEFRAYGYACPPAPERLRQLREAVQILLAMWTQDEATFDGQYYHMRNATIYDKPEHPVPIYISAGGPVTAKFAGREGDGFICTSGKGDELYREQLLPAMEAVPMAASRDPATIERMIEVKVSFDTDK